MSLQNRVDPFGVVTATKARGTMMGNRGGRFHDPQSQKLLSRHWATRQWIICVLCFKNRQRAVMGAGYTELFFLDEVTALAAGHRPCFECRRKAALHFFECHRQITQTPKRMKVAEFDRQLHQQRQFTHDPIAPHKMADGTMFVYENAAWAKCGEALLRWSFNGYDRTIPLGEIQHLQPLTPPLISVILQAGYHPQWHVTARQNIK